MTEQSPEPIPQLPTDAEKDGARVDRFLADPAVVAAFRRVSEGLFVRFCEALGPAEREHLHAQVLALSELRAGLRGVVDEGIVAKQQREKAEAAAAARERLKQRPR